MSGFMQPDVKWTNGKWERRDYPTIMAGWVVRYRAGLTEVSASRGMVCVDGASFTDEAGLAELTDVLRMALKQHAHLRRSDRNDPLP